MNKKLFLMATTMALVTPAIVVPIHSEASTIKDFKDVSSKNVYYDIINEMRTQNIINGYEDGTFRPNETISRKHAAVLVSRAIELPTTQKFVAFKDVSQKNAYFEDIKKLQMAGIIKADAKGNFNPNKPLTRGEMAKILTIAFGLDTTGSTPLKDVSAEYSKYVTALYKADVTTGYEDWTFRENTSLTRAHYAVFMSRAMKYKKTEVNFPDLTEEEVAKFTDKQIVNALTSYKYSSPANLALPSGETNAATLTSNLTKQYKQYFDKWSIDRNTSRLAYSLEGRPDSATANDVKGMAGILQKSVKEMIGLMNQAYSSGELITNNSNDPVIFAMYYDYSKGRLHLGYRTF